MSDPEPPPLGPPAELRWPPEHPGDGSVSTRGYPVWARWLTGLVVIAIVVGVAGTVIRLPYDTLSPGGTLNLETRVSVTGKKTYPARGDIMLLFVQERAHINLWSWLQAKLDPNIDLVKQVDITGGNTQQVADEQDVCDMSQSQSSAQVAALTTLGYHISILPGVQVANLPAGLPAVTVLHPCDQIVSADGRKITQPNDLSTVVKSHRVGTSVVLGIVRAGHALTVRVPVVAPQQTHIIGVEVVPRFKIPLHIDLNTSDISGPSAGLAMALAIIDVLTSGNLTGGKRVAVTGTISPDGQVGEIGGLPQKAVAARAAHAQIFIVPACTDDSCRQDVATAMKRVGKNVELRTVATLAQALGVLRAAGGAPVPTTSTT
jgi:PDZ domain-containing protein